MDTIVKDTRTKKQIKQEARDKARDRLEKIVGVYDQDIFCIIRHVSQSGMTRHISFFNIVSGQPFFLDGLIRDYLGYRYNNQYMSGSINNSCQGTIASNVEQDRWYNAMMYFIQPHDSAYTTNIQGQSAYREGSTGNYGFINFGYQADNTVSHTGFVIQLSSGNFNQTQSTIKVYGIVDS